jgi:hypothetical protein
MKQKKPSIREFVQEDELKYELYKLKYSKELRNSLEKDHNLIINEHSAYTSKRIKALKKLLVKEQTNPANPETSSLDSNTVIRALKHNIDYLENLEAPTNPEKIISKFKTIQENYINYLKSRIEDKELPASVISNHKASLEKITEKHKKDNYGLEIKESKERFGVLLLLMIKNLAMMPSFGGYSDNWKTEFFSNAVEKTLLYMDNFDTNLLSKRTGKESKAFAYITQICFNAFVNIINLRKSEEEFIKKEISYETHKFDGVQDRLHSDLDDQNNMDDIVDYISKVIETPFERKMYSEESKESKESEDNSSQDNQDNQNLMETEETSSYIDGVYTVSVDNLKEDGEITVNNIIKNNKTLEYNKAILDEIQYLKDTTSEDDKTEDYEEYIDDLESKIKETTFNEIINTVVFKIPENKSIADLDYKELHKLAHKHNINIIISSLNTDNLFKRKELKYNKNSFNDFKDGLTNKQKRQLETQEKLKEQEEQRLKDLEDFNNEW